MSGRVEVWPPVDLIKGLGIEDSPVETELDPGVLKELPEGTEIVSITPLNASAWVHTFRVDTIQKDGERKAYFKKNQSGSRSRRLMLGTYESERAIHAYLPANVPRPIAWGRYETTKDTYFYLAEFRTMAKEIPKPIQFVKLVIKLHRESSGKSPSDKLGFHVPTHLANVPNKNKWQESWEQCYTNALSEMMEIEALSQATDDDEEFELLKKKTLALVIPRLLRPLETGGRKIVPCLIHTDLWPGNCMPDAKTGEIIFFDSCAMWGHHEADLGSWRAPRYQMGRPFIQEYQMRMGRDYPAEEWDDRNLLYALRYDFLNSSLFPNTDRFRNDARDSMKYLTEKYQEGLDSWKEASEDVEEIVQGLEMHAL